ncbi:MAG: Spy/CpxP family protein refolding chaperone [Gemmatimonadetes bacterium]|nr:Spy/CpxP family protein refolding chaperone [Gemmatimonadota bacterium]
MKKKLIIWGVVLLTVINLASLATRAYHRWGDDERRGRESRREARMSVTERLGLTEAQAEQVRTMRAELGERMTPYRDGYREKRDQLYDLLMAPDADRGEVDRIKAQMDSLQAEREAIVFEYILAHKDVLTPEQQTKFFAMIKERFRNGYRRR